MRRNQVIREVEALRFAGYWQNCGYNGGVGNAMHGGGLHKRSVHCWHGLAAILTLMTVRRARH
jgi:hypothetical protein